MTYKPFVSLCLRGESLFKPLSHEDTNGVSELRKIELSKKLALKFLKKKIVAFSVGNQILEFVPLKRKQVFDFEVPVGEDRLDNKLVFFAKVNQPVFFAGTEHIERKSCHSIVFKCSRVHVLM
jgi:hypothetical protein